jgi:hypothetical protein
VVVPGAEAAGTEEAEAAMGNLLGKVDTEVGVVPGAEEADRIGLQTSPLIEAGTISISNA